MKDDTKLQGTATINDTQFIDVDNTKILSNIEKHLNSIAESLNKISENGLDCFQKSWR